MKQRGALYGHVIAAYKKAAVWPLHKYAYERTDHKLRAEKWTWISIFSLVLITIFILAFLDNMDVLNTTNVNIIRLIGVAVLILIGFRENKIREKAFKLVFSEDISKYGVMVKKFGAGFEFYRYILFRDEMEKLPEKPITVEPLKDLFDLENKTFGSYVAQKPLMVWIASTSAAVIAASATEWPISSVITWVFVSVLVYVFSIAFMPVFNSEYRRQHEFTDF